jgi:hypothetical protein
MPNETDPFSDRIHIEQLEISAHIVVPEKSASRPSSSRSIPHSRRRATVRDLNDETDRAVNYSHACNERKNLLRRRAESCISQIYFMLRIFGW